MSETDVLREMVSLLCNRDSRREAEVRAEREEARAAREEARRARDAERKERQEAETRKRLVDVTARCDGCDASATRTWLQEVAVAHILPA